MTSRRRASRPALLSSLLAAAVGLSPLLVGVATPAAAASSDIRINEIVTDSTTVEDSIELTNTGTDPVDVSGWVLRDNKDTSSFTLPGGTSIAPGGFLAVDVSEGFGLGNGDSARVFLPDGTTLVDGHTFPSHSAPSWSRCADASGAFVFAQARSETLGEANDCPTVTDLVINEVESSGDAVGDWVEIANPTGLSIDASGLIVRDDKDADAMPVPAGTHLAAGGYAAVYTEPADDPAGFGLGGADSARLYTSDGGTLIDSYTWTQHAPDTTYGRCPDMVGGFALTLAPTRAAANECAQSVGPDDVVINEVKSNPNPDFVELRNVSDHLVDVSNLYVADAGTATPVRLTTESSPVLPGELFAFTPTFGLGDSDEITIYLDDRTTVVDEYAWTSHRIPSYGRCPGSEEMVQLVVASPGEENVCSAVRINEIESSDGENPDWIELVNVTDAPADVSGWILRDSSTDGFELPAGTTVPPGSHIAFDALGFGLGGGDSARLFEPDGTTLVDSYTWTEHAGTTYGRCPDGLGAITTTQRPTKGAANDCPPAYGVETVPWPGSADVVVSDPENAFQVADRKGDISGLAFDPNEAGVLWAIKNKNHLFKLTKVAGLWTPVATDGWAAGKALHYADGTGAPDTEGITIGPDGAIYATSERDNDADTVAYNAVLRYDPTPPGPLTATHEWDLDADFPELDTTAGGSNLGFEGITWVPDSYLVAGGFVDHTGAAYQPASYPNHGTGLYVAALENDGGLYAYALGSDGSHQRVASFASGFPHVMDVSFDPERRQLWAVCDDTCEGQVSFLTLGADGRFAVAGGYDRPANAPNLNNEGFAVAPQATCVNGVEEVVWSDDGATGDHSLRSGTLPCTPVAGPPAASTVTVTGASIRYGQAASVVVRVAAGAAATGQVTLSTATTTLGSATLAADGTATITVPARSLAPSATAYPVTATYAGNDVVAAGSGTATLAVAKAAVDLAASVSPRKLAVGKKAKVTVRLAGPEGVPVTGKVVVTGRGVKKGTASVRNGKAVVTLARLTRPGRVRLTVRYAGSALVEAERVTVKVRVVRR